MTEPTILTDRLPANEAQCPECGGWFPIAWQADIEPGGFWWHSGDGGCPGCGALVCVESECEFRSARARGAA